MVRFGHIFRYFIIHELFVLSLSYLTTYSDESLNDCRFQKPNYKNFGSKGGIKAPESTVIDIQQGPADSLSAISETDTKTYASLRNRPRI